MTQRKPGDYVVRGKLTEDQQKRFVEDCVAAGADDQTGYYTNLPLTLWDTDDISDVSNYPLECQEFDDVRDVTYEYKD